MALIGALVVAPMVRIAPLAATEAKLDAAVLAGDWEKVAAILKQDDAKAADPVARLLMGHASLARNRNNAAFLLFRSMSEPEDLDAWQRWAVDLRKRHPDKPVALYLAADAAARQQRYEEALATFDRALQQVTNDRLAALALDARGVAYVMQGDTEKALVDFFHASQLAPDLADTHASLGTLGVLKETSLAVSGEALSPFDRALAIEPDFALAYNGRGSLLFGNGHLEAAASDFTAAGQLAPQLVIAELNEGLASAYAGQAIALASIETKPGMSLESRLGKATEGLRATRQEVLGRVRDQAILSRLDSMPDLADRDRAAPLRSSDLSDQQNALVAKMIDTQIELRDLNRDMLQLREAVGHAGQALLLLTAAETTLSVNGRLRGLAADLREMTAAGRRELGDQDYRWIFFPFEKQALESVTPFATRALEDDRAKAGLKAVVKLLTSDDWTKAFRAPRLINAKLAEQALQQLDASQERLAKRHLGLAARQRAYERLLHASGVWPVSIDVNRESSRDLPAWLMTGDRPFFDLAGAAAELRRWTQDPMTETRVTRSRVVMVVSRDPFRATAMQQQLVQQGFTTRLAEPQREIPKLARAAGAVSVVGIEDVPSSHVGGVCDSRRPCPTPWHPTLYGGDRLRRDLAPVPTGAFPRTSRELAVPRSTDWSWAKPYTPQVAAAPGGVRTEDIARAFVDRGGWPVLTTFTLGYRPAGEPTAGAAGATKG